VNNFYIYAYQDPNTLDIFYIGKGCGWRYRDISGRKHNKHLYNKIQKYRRNGLLIDDITFKLHENLNETTALQLEIQLIKEYGRRDLGEGSLLNLTDGGDGVVGLKKKLPTLLPFAEDIKRMYLEDGLSMKKIGKKYNCSFTPVYLLLKYLNIPRKKRADINTLKIIEEYKSGECIQELADKYKYDNGSIKKLLIKNSIKIKDGHQYSSKRGGRYSDVVRQQVVKEYKNGSSIRQIATKLKMDFGTVKCILLENNVKIMPCGRSILC